MNSKGVQDILGYNIYVHYLDYDDYATKTHHIVYFISIHSTVCQLNSKSCKENPQETIQII